MDQPDPPKPDPEKRRPARAPVKKRRRAAPVAQAEPEPQGERFEDLIPEELIDEMKAAGPFMAVSFGIHVVLLIVLAFVVLRHDRPVKPKAISSDFSLIDTFGDPKKNITPVEIQAVKIESGNPDEEGGPRPSRKKAPTKTDDSEGVKVLSPSAVNVAGALGGRGNSGGGPGTGASGGKTGGGAGKSDSGVPLGLAWLGRMQQKDGRWELHQGYPDAGEFRTDTGATALALLCYLGAGNTHRSGPHKDKVDKGLKWLINIQKKDGELKGDFHDFTEEGRPTSFYAHGQATIAMCEAYALTRDQALLKPARDGLAFIFNSQHPETGGWKYRRNTPGDLSVFGWQVMALQTARMAGLAVPEDVLNRAAGFLDLVQEQKGARYRYEPDNPAKGPTPAMTAEGLLCRQYLGWPRNHPAMVSGVKYLLQEDNVPNWSSGRRNVYHWYYASQVLHNLGGPDWDEWNKSLCELIVEHQSKGGGKIGGSWDPRKPEGHLDENSLAGGRLYVTCMCLLTLETQYRHLPLYRDVPAASADSDPQP